METRPKHGTTHRTTAREMAEVVPVDSIGGKINDTSSKIQYLLNKLVIDHNMKVHPLVISL